MLFYPPPTDVLQILQIFYQTFLDLLHKEKLNYYIEVLLILL